MSKFKKEYRAYIASNDCTPSFDTAEASTPGRAIGILKRRYPEWPDLCVWADERPCYLDVSSHDDEKGIETC